MKLPRRSLAYGYAKWWLNRRPPRYSPYVALAGAFIVAVLLFMRKRIEPIEYLIATLMFLGAIQAWIDRGIREVFAEQERRIEEMRTSKNA